ncbi:uncharacterized protein DKFZp434B061-like [Phacochoerus africanus]|uniref:uncharacterized protein DKFZp434B061-like n=1 Tax=Phacochoerus africanus TaxID=41426 RepID=UPI001FD9F9D6|nr:uncharacterized protein DKFZp434B061-like [Phacochoerus africanus]
MRQKREGVVPQRLPLWGHLELCFNPKPLPSASGLLVLSLSPPSTTITAESCEISLRTLNHQRLQAWAPQAFAQQTAASALWLRPVTPAQVSPSSDARRTLRDSRWPHICGDFWEMDGRGSNPRTRVPRGPKGRGTLFLSGALLVFFEHPGCPPRTKDLSQPLRAWRRLPRPPPDTQTHKHTHTHPKASCLSFRPPTGNPQPQPCEPLHRRTSPRRTPNKQGRQLQASGWVVNGSRGSRGHQGAGGTGDTSQRRGAGALSTQGLGWRGPRLPRGRSAHRSERDSATFLFQVLLTSAVREPRTFPSPREPGVTSAPPHTTPSLPAPLSGRPPGAHSPSPASRRTSAPSPRCTPNKQGRVLGATAFLLTRCPSRPPRCTHRKLVEPGTRLHLILKRPPGRRSHPSHRGKTRLSHSFSLQGCPKKPKEAVCLGSEGKMFQASWGVKNQQRAEWWGTGPS